MVGSRKFLVILLLILATLFGCENSLEVGLPNSKISSDLAFSDDAAANSAMVGVYMDMYQASSFASGSNVSLAAVAGLSSDELKNVLRNDPYNVEVEENNISISNTITLGLWNSMYRIIYDANAVLSGIDKSSGLTPATRDQLQGEALAIRAFTYFYLINIFGDVPLVTSTDYTVNSSLGKQAVAKIYDQIKTDLQTAEDLLPENYPTMHRVRFNKSAATALLSRVYLYTGDWARAEDKASRIIDNSALYSLEQNLNDTFLIGSKEAIFQLKPADNSSFTFEGYYFSETYGPSNNILSESFVKSFDEHDKRNDDWIIALASGQSVTYLPAKYKKSTLGTSTTEYSMVIRLAEVYLIRSEARAMQGKLSLAIDDIDKIRSRAKTPLIADVNPGISQSDLLSSIFEERKFELFTEWGHRWLDLKRKDLASENLQPLKSKWNETDVLYPIPQSEINKNSNLLPQNPGY